MEDEAYYQIVSDELRDNQINQALWTKAIAKSMGDEPKTKAVYIQLRVQQLMQETIRHRTESEDATPAPASAINSIQEKLGTKATLALKIIAIIALILVILNASRIGQWLRSLMG